MGTASHTPPRTAGLGGGTQQGEEDIAFLTETPQVSAPHWSFHRGVRSQACSIGGPCYGHAGLQGAGGAWRVVHSLVVLLRGRKGHTRWRIQTLQQCGQSCRVVMLIANVVDLVEIFGRHIHTHTHTWSRNVEPRSLSMMEMIPLAHTHAWTMVCSQQYECRAVGPRTLSMSAIRPLAHTHTYTHTHTHTHTRTHTHTHTHTRRRTTEQEVKEARLQRALTSSLNTGLMPSSSLCAKGGAGATNFAGDYHPVMGGGGGAKPPKPRTQSHAGERRHRRPRPRVTWPPHP